MAHMIIPLLICTAGGPAAEPLQYAFTIWDWDPSYREMSRFRKQVDAICGHGFTLLELGAGWKECEPEEGRFDFSTVDERVDYAVQKGLAIRLRVNMVSRPDWFTPELYQLPNGDVFPHFGGYPSVFSESNRRKQLAFAAALAGHFAGRGFTYTPGFSVHMEVKFGEWNTYEPSARKAFHDWLAGRYGSIEALNTAWGADYAHFGEISPPVPAETRGAPSLDAAEGDWIRFREWGLTEWVNAFAVCVRRADPTARVSVPLGESFRRDSARFANLGYWTYSRPADEVVHSYDFFWHGPDHIREVRAAVAAMTGITQRPTVFEIDGPYLISDHGYTPSRLIQAAHYAIEAGAAGIQVSNWGALDVDAQDWMTEIGQMIGEKSRHQSTRAAPSPAILYYVSKWQHYGFREPDEWIHSRQFDFWHALYESGAPVRIVSDENLLEEEIRADYLLLPFNVLIDAPVRDRIRALSHGIRVIADEKPGVYTASVKTRGDFGAKVTVTNTPFAAESRPIAEVLGSPSDTRLRAAVVQFRSTSRVTENAERMIAFLREAAAQEVRVAVFPEMALTGYTKKKDFAASIDWETINEAIARICAACAELRIYAVFGAPARTDGHLYCAAYAVAPSGEIIDIYEKIYLAGEQWASPGRRLTVFPVDGVRCGTLICHDERYAPLVQLRALDGAQLFFYISCESGIHAEHKIAPYRAQIQARAVENGVYILHANTPASLEDAPDMDASHGHSRIIAPDGNLLGEASVYGEEMLIRDIDLSYAKTRGLDAALSSGPLASWMKKGVRLVRGTRNRPTR